MIFRKHVYHDIRPFICTFEECGLLMFDDKRSWFEHEMDNHRRYRLCALCNSAAPNIQTSQDLLHHFKTQHGIHDQEHMRLLSEVSSRPMEMIPARDCKLCDWDAKLRSRNEHVPSHLDITVSPRVFMHHLSFHLTQVALFVLPKPPEQDAAKASSLDGDAGSGRSSGLSAESNVSVDFKVADSHRLALWASIWFCTTRLTCAMTRARRKLREQELKRKAQEEEDDNDDTARTPVATEVPSLSLSQHVPTRSGFGIRLLTLNNNGEPVLAEDYDREQPPPYAVLSHTWGAEHEEVTLHDLESGHAKQKYGYRKILFCGQQAQRDGLKHFWVDSCCIDKSSHAELSISLNSMFRWYAEASKCYVYLQDVSACKRDSNGHVCNWKAAFQKSRWFTRGCMHIKTAPL